MKKKIGKTTGTLAFVVVFCFVLVSLAQATDEPAGRNWANNNLENKNKAVSIPVWKITRPGRANSVSWVDHGPNPRFAVHDDQVLDKETGLIWVGRPFCSEDWRDAIWLSREYTGGNRMGWRLPTIEELSSLLDPSEKHTPPSLPEDHPFGDVDEALDQCLWSSSTYEVDSDFAWTVHLFENRMGIARKSETKCCWWPVRGGNGYATGNW